ncbi:wax ester/triacylglycerol synthase domain-containing protein, partial [Actinomadura sp. BRA 177]|uniref:wax ester/triacylglycerol synthase domain-containing protein n=1 Tax=Actinomadura sp. BRA 177 TaxID=2745202 RepID=UPI0017D1403D
PGRERRAAAADAFFLHVESRDVPQVVGGVAEFTGRGPSAERVRALFAERLPRLPRLTQRVRPGGAFRRPRWVETGTVDLRRHVREVDLPASGGRRALDGLVARLVAEPLDPGRPLWRFWLVRRGSAGPDAVVVLFHYAIADGIGVVDILRGLLDPALPAVGPARGPGRLTRAAAVLPRLVQLGLDATARTAAATRQAGPAPVPIPPTTTRHSGRAARPHHDRPDDAPPRPPPN